VTARDPLFALGRDVAATLDRGEPARLARQRARLLTTDLGAARARPLARFALAAAALITLGGVALSLRAPTVPRAATTDPALTPGAWFAAGARAVPLPLGDAARVVVEPGARVRLVAFDARGAELAVERGVLDVRVRHRDDTRWTLRTGPWSVEVTGTSFRLGWSPATERMELEMREGSVRVRGPGGVTRMVVAGERMLADPREGLRPAAGPAVAPVELVARAVRDEEVLRAPQSPPPSRPRRAARALRVPPAVAPAPPRPEAALADAADRARYEGRVGDARALLLDLRARHPDSGEARRAAYHLGVLALEAQRAPRVAARWFEIALHESPQGPLRRECLGRRVQALHAAGDVAGARAAAERYLREDPDGAFAPFARDVRAR
jgi:hypothetical protein